MNIILHDFEIQNLFKNGRGQIRRAIPIKFLPGYNPEWTGYKPIFEYGRFFLAGSRGEPATKEVKCPFGTVGEEIWVKETWCPYPEEGTGRIWYRAADERSHDRWRDNSKMPKHLYDWRSPVTMPREASRLTIIPERIWTEPLQKISPSDAFCSGITRDIGHQLGMSVSESEETFNLSYQPKDVYKRVWNRHNKPGYKWADNPMVFVGEMRILK